MKAIHLSDVRATPEDLAHALTLSDTDRCITVTIWGDGPTRTEQQILTSEEFALRSARQRFVQSRVADRKKRSRATKAGWATRRRNEEKALPRRLTASEAFDLIMAKFGVQ